MAETLYESISMRRFSGIDLDEIREPDETTICRLLHLLECQHLDEKIWQQVHHYLDAHGIQVGTRTIVNAGIIGAPSPTKDKDKDKDKQCDPDMHQTKKGNQWYFGMKAHIGVDSETDLIHTVAATPANVHDATCLPDLSHGEETRIWDDSASQGQGEAIRAPPPKTKDFINRRYRYKDRIDEVERARNPTKSRVRAKVEHPLLVIKRVFGFANTRYRGLEKNAQRLFVTSALTNLYLMRRRLLRLAGA